MLNDKSVLENPKPTILSVVLCWHDLVFQYLCWTFACSVGLRSLRYYRSLRRGNDDSADAVARCNSSWDTSNKCASVGVFLCPKKYAVPPRVLTCWVPFFPSAGILRSVFLVFGELWWVAFAVLFE